MSNPEFEPKIGKPRSRREIKSGRFTRMVVKATTRQRAPKSPWATALTRRPVAELGRGKGGALYGLTPPQPGWRRVIVKARIARHGTSDLAAARTHQHYIMRDGVTRDGGPGQLYDREHDVADGGDFLERQKGDTYQFRLIIAPEDGGRMADLKPFVRDLMRNMEEDLRTKLDWVAVDHFNTGHPHTHIVIAGHDDRGQDLVIARHYISHGIRHRAQDLVTLELGPEQEFERIIKLANEMKAERFTSLDRGIIKDAKENVLVVSAMPDSGRGRSERREDTQHSLRVGRLRRLEQMRLAEEKRTGVWAIDPQLESKLRSLGERGDIMVTLNRVMRARTASTAHLATSPSSVAHGNPSRSSAASSRSASPTR
jgi:type IV secretory pathway VirD2 relaxase